MVARHLTKIKGDGFGGYWRKMVDLVEDIGDLGEIREMRVFGRDDTV